MVCTYGGPGAAENVFFQTTTTPCSPPPKLRFVCLHTPACAQHCQWDLRDASAAQATVQWRPGDAAAAGILGACSSSGRSAATDAAQLCTHQNPLSISPDQRPLLFHSMRGRQCNAQARIPSPPPGLLMCSKFAALCDLRCCGTGGRPPHPPTYSYCGRHATKTEHNQCPNWCGCALRPHKHPCLTPGPPLTVQARLHRRPPPPPVQAAPSCITGPWPGW
jgi:hypothetical protein